MAKSYRYSRRRGMSNKDAVLQGIMGAGIGALNYKLQQWETERAEASEIRKAERLEQIQIAREGRQAETARIADERNFSQQKEVIGIEGKMRTDAAREEATLRRDLNREDNAARMSQIGAQISANRDEIGLREQSQLRLQANEAKLRQQYAPNSDGVWGSDNKWYPTGQPIPAGVTPMVGAGVSALTRSGGSSLTPLSPGARPMMSPKPPAGWSATVVPADD